MKIRQWEQSCCIQTDTTKLIVAYRNFSDAPKSVEISPPPIIADVCVKIQNRYLRNQWSLKRDVRR